MVTQKDLSKYVRENTFDYSDPSSLKPVTETERQAIFSVVNSDKHFTGYTLLDVANRPTAEGGGSGMMRYWLLLSKANNNQIIELKQADKPGVEFGRHTRILSMDERLPILKKAFWDYQSDNDYFYLMVDKNRFLARSRMNKKGLKLEDMKGNELKDVLFAEASTIANLHSSSWNDVKKDDLRSWLWESSKTLSERWLTTYNNYKQG